MAQSTVSDLNSLFAEIYEDAIFVAREMMIMPSLVTNYTAVGMQDRNLGIYPQFSASVKAEGVDFANPTTFTKTSDMSITPYVIMTQGILTDERIATDRDDARRDLAREMGGAIATKIDTDLVGQFSSMTANTAIGASGSTMTVKKVAAGIAVLRDQKAPNPLNVVLHPFHWHRPNCALAA